MTEDSTSKVADDLVVSMHYTLTVEGEAVDSSSGRDPLSYLHGHKNIVPGLESEITGRGVGDTFDATVSAELGYGERKEEAVQEVPLVQLPDDVEAGMQLQAQTPGGAMLVHVTEVKDGNAVLDFNHPLAGKELNFAVEITAIRTATPDELEKGQPVG